MEEKTILVIEDEIPLLEAIKIKLENNNIRVVTARSYDQAIFYLQDLGKVDGIWLDHYLLGKENGLDLVATIKNDGATWKQIPIFVVSNTAGEEKVKTYLQLGVDKFFVKSDFRLDQIIEEIKKCMYGNTN